MMATRVERITQSGEWRFFGVVWRAAPGAAAIWWLLIVLRGVLPAVLAIAIGALIEAVTNGDPLGGSLVVVGVVFVALQVTAPLHAQLGANLGDLTASRLHDMLMVATTDPPGIAHLERADLADDLTLARDFELGISGPPLAISMGFIAAGLVQIAIGLASACVLFGYRWWAPPLLVMAWGSTHWLLRESAIWRDRQTPEVLDAQRHADYTYRLAVDPPAAKELRVFGLADWTVDRFAQRRRRLVDLRWEATRLRQKPLRWTLLVVLMANTAVLWSIAIDAADGRIGVGAVVTYAQVVVGTSALAFGGLNWALSLAAQTVDAVLRLEGEMAPAGALTLGDEPVDGRPNREIRFRDVTFTYETGSTPVLDGFELTIPAGSSLAIVGQNGAGKTTLAKLLCRLYDPQSGAVEVDGIDLRTIDLDGWRTRLAAVFQDYVRYERPLRDNVAPLGAPDEVIHAALADAGAATLVEDLGTILARGYDGGTELSGGQWQRVALARTLCAVRQGAGVVILDEPTAQLDVRGEAEVFERILGATRSCTTILVSHRFSTVRHADRICVLEAGRVVELGSHDELMALGGRYRRMFDLQASRFGPNGAEAAAEDDVVSLD